MVLVLERPVEIALLLKDIRAVGITFDVSRPPAGRKTPVGKPGIKLALFLLPAAARARDRGQCSRRCIGASHSQCAADDNSTAAKRRGASILGSLVRAFKALAQHMQLCVAATERLQFLHRRQHIFAAGAGASMALAGKSQPLGHSEGGGTLVGG